MSSSQSVARRVLEAFAAAGVQTAFGLPGVHNLSFWRETGPGLPRIVGVRHEQTAVYAADGLARATGGLGVALTTTGPGAANAAGAFGEAAASGTPLVLVASEVSTALTRPGVSRGILHECRDQAGIFEPLAKAVFRPRTAEDACAAVAEAIRTAMTSPRGPVYVDIPTDVLNRPGPAVPPLPIARVAPDDAAVRALHELVEASPSVVLWVGGGAVQADAAEEVAALAERLQAPVVTTYTARGILPPDSPHLVGLPPHEPEIADLVAGADLLIGIGSDFDGMMTRNWSMPLPRAMATINCAAEDLTKNYPFDVAVLGDAREALRALLALPTGPRPAGAGRVREVRERCWTRLSADPRAAAGLELLGSLHTATPEGTVVVADMAIPGYWFGGYGTVRGPRTLQYPVGWGTLGYALPASVGPGVLGDRPVLAVCGDGGFMFAVGELATIAQENLPVTVLVVDDGGYGMLRYDQDHAGDEHRGVDLLRPDFAALAESFGIPATRVTGLGEPLAKALGAALSSRAPRLVVTEATLTPPRTTSPRWAE
ncbi:thiamine pyrophosphate-binding protein [Blastococcus xanthinilyticus]|uniref:Acetolactate synthase-1/2/3 large subunit n=1 Tax=Blastococcus xanthinilyticus TaxID=1564164 RepID=A0A5S5CXW1_9ACTN|nr:thiamine pyrophosphate-binding protein [Blastococcus xanthinilyticus]TYP87656.1 acetolactate synthase-1/2/3 large subunit [Blastococcus xanthinilyticus]